MVDEPSEIKLWLTPVENYDLDVAVRNVDKGGKPQDKEKARIEVGQILAEAHLRGRGRKDPTRILMYQQRVGDP